MAHVIFPNQLFEDVDTYVPRDMPIYLYEEPSYFAQHINQIKIDYMRACMKAYMVHLQSHGYPVTYIKKLPSSLKIQFIDPFDVDLVKKYKPQTIQVLKHTPQFLYKGGYESITPNHASFYTFMKKQLGLNKILPATSTDQENRQPIPTKLPSLPPKHKIMPPTTFQEARTALHSFLKNSLKHFGPYQDAISKSETYLYHANISAALNIGILTPQQVVKETLTFISKHQVPMNSLEGFLRQVIGWREYMYYIYITYAPQLYKANHWNNNLRIKNWKPFFTGNTTIDVLDNEIKKAQETGYAHHIVRLMIFLNFFVLMKIHPHDIVHWFMSVCSIDAYPWVMWSNIIAMGWFHPQFMRKPYISTEAYILKMSDYKKPECKIWRSLFYEFLYSNKSKLTGSSKIYLRNLTYFENLPRQEKFEIINRARSFRAIFTH